MTSVTVFLGAGGGAGTTSSAIVTARRQAGRVLLVDLDIWSGTLAQRLGLEPTVSLADLAAVELQDIDSDAIAAVSWRIGGGLELIPAPSRPELADVIDPQLVATVLELVVAGDQYDAVVIDAGSRLDLAIWHACMRANLVVICSRRSAGAQARVANLVDVLDRSRCPACLDQRRALNIVGYHLVELAARVRRTVRSRQPAIPPRQAPRVTPTVAPSATSAAVATAASVRGR
ncbi:MAG: hypothetical protein H7123_00790 [Thermoleophilia bacterium]|nr:hypothetical protein [Thermoleophilia bacterium]